MFVGKVICQVLDLNQEQANIQVHNAEYLRQVRQDMLSEEDRQAQVSQCSHKFCDLKFIPYLIKQCFKSLRRQIFIFQRYNVGNCIYSNGISADGT